MGWLHWSWMHKGWDFSEWLYPCRWIVIWSQQGPDIEVPLLSGKLQIILDIGSSHWAPRTRINQLTGRPTEEITWDPYSLFTSLSHETGHLRTQLPEHVRLVVWEVYIMINSIDHLRIAEWQIVIKSLPGDIPDTHFFHASEAQLNPISIVVQKLLACLDEVLDIWILNKLVLLKIRL